jgi:hypothetical protein
MSETDYMEFTQRGDFFHAHAVRMCDFVESPDAHEISVKTGTCAWDGCNEKINATATHCRIHARWTWGKLKIDADTSEDELIANHHAYCRERGLPYG